MVFFIEVNKITTRMVDSGICHDSMAGASAVQLESKVRVKVRKFQTGRTFKEPL